MKLIILFIFFIFLSGCSGFTILLSGTSIVASQNIYSKVYGGADIITVIGTDKSIKTHIYDIIKDNPNGPR